MTITRFKQIEAGYKCETCGVVVPSVDRVPYHACGSRRSAPVDLGCEHRGAEVRREPCETCGGHVLLKVFACAKHGECCVDKTVDPVRSCSTCPDKKLPRVTARPVPKASPQNGMFAYSGGVPEFVTAARMTEDARALAGSLPANVSGIVGVARSGMTVATLVSMYCHRPLYVFRQQPYGDLVPTGNGWRLTGHVDDVGPLVVVDDTVMTGNSLNAVMPKVRAQHPTALSAALYVNPSARTKPDLWVRDLPWPHLLEWNMFNSILTPHTALDFDGVLCRDCTAEQDDDGPRYAEFLRDVEPLYYVRKTQIPMIVTGRLEKYRSQTQDWLERKGMTVVDLRMRPSRQTDPVRWKADNFRQFMRLHHQVRPPIFVESDPRQAEGIAELSGGIVACPSAGRCWKF